MSNAEEKTNLLNKYSNAVELIEWLVDRGVKIPIETTGTFIDLKVPGSREEIKKYALMVSCGKGTTQTNYRRNILERLLEV